MSSWGKLLFMKRLLYLTAGWIALGLGIIGAVLPVLPTTPFLLLAAACFSQSSERWHQWLLNNRYAGPMIRDWEEKRCVSLRTKIVAISSMVVVGGLSVTFGVENTAIRIFTIGLMSIGAVTVLSLRTCSDCAESSE